MSVDALTRTREPAPSALVEREEPVAALQGHLTDASANGRLVLLRGEAGIFNDWNTRVSCGDMGDPQ